jgi:hypothetical protein
LVEDLRGFVMIGAFCVVVMVVEMLVSGGFCGGEN